ncbi:N-formylglutamate amidohydrolase [Burkholderia multivorans]|uniref:N-formylglutamate amidohydrolase n=1 Tax=Burkholderia multivorans TaxID=87883 RepID=UPI002019F076|nr:N-formylglutamate amidohydrolase [Burkholderia multivorans]MCO1368531.1 N-formylglutamate amidohydrolase [Burkholderia multivorans]MCO1380422.1 N-formylglutamate amidohydrolase [Burkholderia multivorans]UQP21467.1 N-formylglutamate amidohydrolase [Burkholderia multivorans]UQP92086.1 N-formylglutamate amidohydrolase [Burkholderia multivorans]
MPEELKAHEAWKPIDGRLSDPAGVALLEAAQASGVTTIAAAVHPCVIDLNVALDNRPLSQRLNRTGLCRTHTSRGEALYAAGSEPSEAEVEARVERYWRPFHAALTAELLRLREMHGNVLLLTSHASSWLSPYRSHAGTTDCNAGTDQGASCDRRLVSALTATVQGFGRSWVVNGKLADVYAAQRYGMPEYGMHAIEMEAAGRWRGDFESPERDKSDEMSEVLDALTRALDRLPPASARFEAGLVADRPAA